MAVVRNAGINRNVSNLAARDAITPKIDGMTVKVADSTGDPIAGSGLATYRWDGGTSTWLLEADDDSVTFTQEEKTKLAGIEELANVGALIDDNISSLTTAYSSEKIDNLISNVTTDYFYDSVRNKYLSISETIVIFYKNGKDKKNQYLFNVPKIPSSSVPQKLFSDFCIVAIETYTKNTIPNNTDIIEIRNNDTDANILTITNDTGSSQKSFYNDSLNIDVLSETNLSGFILDYQLDNPVVKLHLRKIVTP